MLNTALILFFPFFMAYAAASDLVSMTISNRISVALIAGFAVFSFLIGMPLSQMGWHWAMFGLVLFGGFSLFALGIIGGGDAKLAAATALWLGWEHIMAYLVVASILGGLLTLLLLKLRSTPLPGPVSNIGWVCRLHSADSGVPYGIALAGAALAVYPDTPWMQHVFAAARITAGG